MAGHVLNIAKLPLGMRVDDKTTSSFARVFCIVELRLQHKLLEVQPCSCEYSACCMQGSIITSFTTFYQLMTESAKHCLVESNL